jgi:hypothetical protein
VTKSAERLFPTPEDATVKRCIPSIKDTRV